MHEIRHNQAPSMPPPFAPPQPIGFPGDVQRDDEPREPIETSQKNDRFHAQFWKTQLCRFYKSGCRNGDNCIYAHGNRELLSRPDLTKTSLCKNWRQGKCDFSSSNCIFAHGHSELRTTPLFEATSGNREQEFEGDPLQLQNAQGGFVNHFQVGQQGSEPRADIGSWNMVASASNSYANAVPSEPPWVMPQNLGYDSANSTSYFRPLDNFTAQQPSYDSVGSTSWFRPDSLTVQQLPCDVSSTSWFRSPDHLTTQQLPQQDRHLSMPSRALPKALREDSSFPEQQGFQRTVGARPSGQLEGFASHDIDRFSGGHGANALRFQPSDFHGSFQMSREVLSGLPPQNVAGVNFGAPTGDSQHRALATPAYGRSSREQMMRQREIWGTVDDFGATATEIVDLDAYRMF